MTTSAAYRGRAQECARLANQTGDELLKRDLLLLRQQYLRTAERLDEVENKQG